MTPPLKDFPLIARIPIMFVMFACNIGLMSILAMMLVNQLFGIDNAIEVLSRAPQSANEINAFLFVQAFSSIGGFVITALAFAQLQAGNASDELKLNRLPSLKFLALGIVAIFAAQIFVDVLVQINRSIPLPGKLSFLRNSQKNADDIINALLTFKQPGQFVAVSIVLAVIPAVGEEMFFRGLLLGSMLKSKVNPAFSIIFTGFVFSAFHGEFDNTLAIWVLGAFLGYLYYVSGSLWLSIAAHFINNFLAVLFKYLYVTGKISSNLAEADMPVYATIISFLIFVFCIFLLHRWKQRTDTDDIINSINAI